MADKRGRPRLRGKLHLLREAMNALGKRTMAFAEAADISHMSLRRAERAQPVRFPVLVKIEQHMEGVVCALVLEAEAHGYEPMPGPWLDWWNARPDTAELAKAHAEAQELDAVKLRYVGEPHPDMVA